MATRKIRTIGLSLTFIGIWLLIHACGKEEIAPKTGLPAIFEDFWSKMESNYLYWDSDTVNWDKVHTDYSPLFDKLDINSQADREQAVLYFNEIAYKMIDGHLSITYLQPDISAYSFTPSLVRKTESWEIKSPFPYYENLSRYISADLKQANLWIEEQRSYLHIVSGRIDSNIGYLYWDKFNLLQSYHSASNAALASEVLDSFFSLLEAPNPVKKVILDVRGNRGGEVVDLQFVMEKLIDKPLHFGYTRNKISAERLNYSPWLPAIIKNKYSNHKPIQIILLIDRFSASMAETMAFSVDALPNGFTIGEVTWGATGPISDPLLFNGGSFIVQDFMKVTTSSSAFRDLSYISHEGSGYSPNHHIFSNWELLSKGVDKQLEYAIATARSDP